MKKLLSFLLLIAFSTVAWADHKDLTSVFDRRNAAVTAGDLDGVLTVMSARLKKDAQTELATAEQKKGALDFWKQTLVSPYAVEGGQVSPDGKKAILFLTGEVTNPKGKKETIEQQLEFVKEGGAWKIDGVMFGAPTSQIKRSKDDAFEPEDRYDASKSTNLGGRIVKTEYKDTYTVVTIRVLDEENLVYLPSKAVLLQKKITIGNFEPGKAYSFDAYPHKTNKFKYWGNGGEPVSYFQ